MSEQENIAFLIEAAMKCSKDSALSSPCLALNGDSPGSAAVPAGYLDQLLEE
jgi:hypothetical protein